MANSTANDVAEALISLSYRQDAALTNLKLQKLLYYTQAWHLVFHDDALFNDEIQAWVHGPVVPTIFRKFKEYRWNPLPNTRESKLDSATEALLLEVWKVYGKFDASKLESLTHSEAPWKDARKGLAPDEASHNVISQESMKQFYASLIHA
jgi:uncharacterized phage-associated protein